MDLLSRFEALVIELYQSKQLVLDQDHLREALCEAEDRITSLEESLTYAKGRATDLQFSVDACRTELAALKFKIAQDNAPPLGEWDSIADGLILHDTPQIDKNGYITWDGKIAAIRAFRERCSTGLKEAKDAIEAAGRRRIASRFNAL